MSRGTLTMRFGDEVRRAGAGPVARVAPGTVRSHRNEGDEPVELWAISRRTNATAGPRSTTSGRRRQRPGSTSTRRTENADSSHRDAYGAKTTTRPYCTPRTPRIFTSFDVEVAQVPLAWHGRRVDGWGRKVALVAAVTVIAATLAIVALVPSGDDPSSARAPVAPHRGAVLDVRATAAAISPDGRRCVTLDRAGGTSLWSCADGERLRERPGPAGGTRASVAYTRDGVAILDLVGGRRDGCSIPVTSRSCGACGGRADELVPAISPSGVHALRPLSPHTAAIVDTRRRPADRRAPPHPGPRARDGGLLRRRPRGGRDHQAAVLGHRLRRDHGEPLNSFALEDTSAHVDLSADGKRLLIADGTTVRIVDVLTGIERERFSPPGRGLDRFVRRQRALRRHRRRRRDGLRVGPDDGPEVAEYAGGPGAVASATLAADGRLLVAGRGGLAGRARLRRRCAAGG